MLFTPLDNRLSGRYDKWIGKCSTLIRVARFMFTYYKDLGRAREKIKIPNECPRNISLLSVLYLLLGSLLDLKLIIV